MQMSKLPCGAWSCVILALGIALPDPAPVQESEADLAKKLANPISSLINVPFQHNLDCCFGSEDANGPCRSMRG
jgi:hypothetical protein